MELISKKVFRQLAEAAETPSVSIFIPLTQEGDKLEKNRIRLKNHLSQAEKVLQERCNLSADEAVDLLQPAAQLIQDGRFTGDLEEGLAVFLSSEQSHIYSLPVRFDEQSIVSSHFYLKPLLPLLTENGRFYILALSQNEIRLLQATKYAVHEVILPEEMPQNLAEALKWEDPEYQLQWHTGPAANVTNDRRAVFHGHGVTNENSKKDNIREYFQQIAGGIDELLKEQSVPLVLAGVDYLLPIYEEASDYSHILEEKLHGNPEQFSARELRDQAWELVAPHFAQEQEEAKEHIADKQGTDMVTEDITSIIAAAHFGQVELLFLAEDAQFRGVFDTATGVVRRAEGNVSVGKTQTLLERTAVYTILYGGTVYLLPPEEMPEDLPALALLRAPVSTLA